ncbi:Bug family tripartite tricarboxylate transporter substrate binding protein [Rhodoplanes sp. Z2-YC6860]|uniref:Bug family tripartite tricarboxylate transporter substrate binding protein n=1 Tax=Rhodoplanes sp. Z2-YC6860 TaxID=674703 RepID=UPI00078DE9BF|nr:tripartite tricarboxylate transporter substrate binding protein [Rhodoplanes sp. Z2-YC6860]AMN44487.1 extra-cytoplasmic solute receptor [Rhodoplanes sp. Z2-YC6860]
MKLHRLAFTTVLLALTSASALAQNYPNRPIRVLVPFAAGGAVDTLARLVGQKLSENLGQPVIIENRPGAGGNLASDVLAKAPPDGYTVLQTVNGLAISPSLYKTLPFNVEKDFIAVTQIVQSQLLLVANPKLEANNVAELIKLAKAKPGSLNYGSTGVGNPLSLTMEMLKSAAGIEVQPVTYRGDAPANAALIAGEIQLGVMPMATTLPLVESGQLKALAVGGLTRAPALPNVPTVAETIPGFDSTSWQSYFVPAGTPREIVLRLQQETAKALKNPDVIERLKAGGNEGVGSTPEEFDRVFRADIIKFAKIIADAKIPKLD